MGRELIVKPIFLSCMMAAGLIACEGAQEPEHSEDLKVAVEQAAAAIPEELAPFGDGYPKSGDPCRRLGESTATVAYLDDSAVLVGCPTAAAAEAIGGTVLNVVEGTSIVSVATSDANEGMPGVGVEPAIQVEGIELRRISFASGANSAAVEDNITGSEIVDYALNVRQGQSMNISMASKNPSTYFNIMEPGETNVAMFIGSTSGNQFEGTASKNGDYRIRVYLMRSAARRGETATYRLETIVD